MRVPTLLVSTLLLCLVVTPATATVPEFVGTRALGMGGAMRGSATGDAALNLNPSGMSLTRAYVVEGAYQFSRPSDGHLGHVSVVDSTSGFNLAAGIYYTYLNASPDGRDRSGHEGGVSLAFPFGDLLHVGATAKYLRLRSTGEGVEDTTRGITFDVGATIRPVQMIGLGVVGYNLRDLDDPQAPVSVGFGVSVAPVPALLLVADGFVDLTTTDETRGNVTSFMGGGEFLIAQKFAIRAGGGLDGRRDRGYGTLGFSLVGVTGALDVAARQELEGTDKATFIGASARLFVPAL
jgi:hypothetical protein